MYHISKPNSLILCEKKISKLRNEKLHLFLQLQITFNAKKKKRVTKKLSTA